MEWAIGSCPDRSKDCLALPYAGTLDSIESCRVAEDPSRLSRIRNPRWKRHRVRIALRRLPPTTRITLCGGSRARAYKANVADEEQVNILAEGVRKVSGAIEELRVDLVYPREWRRVDPSALILRNMNAPGDYDEARKWWATRRSSEREHVRQPPPAPKRKRRPVPRRRK